jgi:hypothetical protein
MADPTNHARAAAEKIAAKAIEVSNGVTLDDDERAVAEVAEPLVQIAIDAATAEKDAEIQRWKNDESRAADTVEMLMAHLAAAEKMVEWVRKAAASAWHEYETEMLMNEVAAYESALTKPKPQGETK